MPDEGAVAEHWAKGDVYTVIISALERAGKAADSLGAEHLAPVDHFHAWRLPAAVELADALAVAPGHRILDIGCGIGGPAR